MSALARKTLEWLADRANHSHGAAAIAEWLDEPLPKVQGALGALRDMGHARYFEGHPGSWACTRQGFREIRFDTDSEAARFRMALEAVAGSSQSYEGSVAMKSIARQALNGGRV